MSRRNKDKGRLPDFVPLIRSTLKTAAWRAMSHGARSYYTSLKARYNTRLQNGVYMSARLGAEELGSSKDYVARWHHELIHYGFIRPIEGKEAHLGIKGEGMAAHVRLTEHSYAGQLPTRDFDRWNGAKFKYQKRRQKQKPVLLTGDTPSYKLGTVRASKTVPTAEACPTNWGHREAGIPVLQTGDITSLTTPLAVSVETLAHAPTGHNAGPPLEPEPEPTGLMEWTTPILTEMPYTDELRRLYAEAVPADNDLSIPEFLRRTAQ
jgi:hypothetical protein